ncbi:hypothetical protein ACE6H2_003162 [Prunus campanulata]
MGRGLKAFARRGFVLLTLNLELSYVTFGFFFSFLQSFVRVSLSLHCIELHACMLLE